MGLDDRIERLERLRPAEPHEPSPIVSLLLKSMDKQRRELDGRPPDPENDVFTEAEKEADLQAAYHMLEWVRGERSRRQSPDTLAHIAQLEEHAKSKIAQSSKGASS